MKYPKLRNTILCQFLLYLPGLSFVLYVLALVLIPGAWRENSVLMIAGFLLTGGFSIWYLLHNAVILIASDMLFCTIRQWKRDRTEYRTLRNGKNRTEIQRTLLRRCALWGRRFYANNQSDEFFVYYRHSLSWTVFWSVIEKRVAVCTADMLTAEKYRSLTGQARMILPQIPDGKPRFKTKSEKKSPIARAFVVLILADTVEEGVKSLARKPLVESEEMSILPCVVSCADGCYYTDCTAAYYESGMMARPAGNIASAMIRRLVFSYRLPKENRLSQPEPAFDQDLNMSIWEYCGIFHHEMSGASDDLKKDRLKAYNHLKNGQTRIGDCVIWFKWENKLAEYSFLPDEEAKTVVLVEERTWYYRKTDNAILRVMRVNSLNRRKMKKNDADTVRQYMEAALAAEGYRIERDGE